MARQVSSPIKSARVRGPIGTPCHHPPSSQHLLIPASRDESPPCFQAGGIELWRINRHCSHGTALLRIVGITQHVAMRKVSNMTQVWLVLRVATHSAQLHCGVDPFNGADTLQHSSMNPTQATHSVVKETHIEKHHIQISHERQRQHRTMQVLMFQACWPIKSNST